MSPTEASASDNGEAPTRQAACFECRRSKIKCMREDAEPGPCRRCRANAIECITPEYHVGRYKGVKNKRTGLEKAIHQVEQALKRTKGNAVVFDPDSGLNLRQLIGPTQQPTSRAAPAAQISRTPAITVTGVDDGQPSLRASGSRHIGDGPDPVENADDIALDNADNPLQLLAEASALPNKTSSTSATASPISQVVQGTEPHSETIDEDLQRFFGSPTPVLDNATDTDPVEMGLVTVEESEFLFKYFYEHLSHTRWGLDPLLHRLDFVRSRSSFLFTSVLAASATFLPDTAALAKRLSTHRDRLAHKVASKRYKSVEIVLAFLINIPWMAPGKHWTDDQTCAYLSMALTLALDLQLNKIVVPSTTIRPPGFLHHVPKAECIDAGKALQLDGFSHVEPTSACGKRFLRNRERVWLALFVLDRGVCLARGRPYAVPPGPLIESCDTWHVSDIADRWDGSLVATAVLRRDLVGLISAARETSNYTQLSVTSDASAVKLLKDKTDKFFQQWYTIWSYQISQADGTLPPYLEIIVPHTKLSVYCSVINHPTASSEVKQFFRAAGLASALDVMRAIVDGEHKLKSIPNNSVIMASFAACFALGLSTTRIGDRAILTPNARALIEQTALALIRIGATPKHRNGTSALFGRHIQRIMKTSFPDQDTSANVQTNPTTEDAPDSPQPPASFQAAPSSFDSQAYPFDMTDDQLIEAINNAGASQEMFQPEDNMFLDWLEWPNAA